MSPLDSILFDSLDENVRRDSIIKSSLKEEASVTT